MGLATVDLPDPLETPPVDLHSELPLNAADLASADDLLSQLAGDDIDRLLAEAETAIVPPPDSRSPVQPVPLEQLADETAIDAVIADVEAEVTATIGQEPEVIVPPPTAGLVAEELPTIEAQEAAALQAVLQAAATSAAELPPALPEMSPVDSSDSHDADAHAIAVAATAESDPVDSHSRPPSPLVRFLQLINSPLAWLGEPVRDAIGKIALLTLFNAIAVIAYVLLFRSKHPH